MKNFGLFFALISLFFHSNLFCQASLTSVELLGKSPYLFNISYETYTDELSSAGFGLSFINYKKSNTTLTRNYRQENEYQINAINKELVLGMPFYAYQRFGSANSAMIAGLGVTVIFSRSVTRSSEGKNKNRSLHLIPFASIGYEHRSNNNFVFRIPAYIAYTGKGGGVMLPKFFPWIGVSYGYYYEN